MRRDAHSTELREFTELFQDILRVMCFWERLSWDMLRWKRKTEPAEVEEHHWKSLDLKYAFDAESTHAKPTPNWGGPRRFKPDGL